MSAANTTNGELKMTIYTTKKVGMNFVIKSEDASVNGLVVASFANASVNIQDQIISSVAKINAKRELEGKPQLSEGNFWEGRKRVSGKAF
jgi:hypothetical protein